jgi:hypothetical protein
MYQTNSARLKLTLLTLIVSIVASAAVAQERPKPVHQQTSPPANARFEVVQSTLVARITFRLDRFTGRVWQLVQTKDDGIAWEETAVVDLPKLSTATRPRFQIFTSGFAARNTFLVDTDIGKSWVIVASKRKNADGSEYEENIWQPFVE